MNENEKQKLKDKFLKDISNFAKTLKNHVSANNEWTIKGFIDIFENIYSISSDTKIISKIFEIHLFPKFLEFANKYNYEIILAEKQNWYPDISFVSKTNDKIKFALDLKTTYKLEDKPNFCNGFTLGSHGEYFTNRNSSKNIQFSYNQYLGHYCLGIIYTRNQLANLENVNIYKKDDLLKIPSVVCDFEIFVSEKWKIASDKSGSGNTANIGSITYIEDILNGNGVFSKLGENWFDEYWINYNKITFNDKKITDVQNYLKYRGKDEDWIKQNVIIKKTTGNIKKNG